MNKHYDPNVPKTDAPKTVAIVHLFLWFSVLCFITSVIIAVLNG